MSEKSTGTTSKPWVGTNSPPQKDDQRQPIPDRMLGGCFHYSCTPGRLSRAPWKQTHSSSNRVQFQRIGPQRQCWAGWGSAHFSVTFTRTLPRAATLQPQPNVSEAPLPVPCLGMHTHARTHTEHKSDRKETQMTGRLGIPGTLGLSPAAGGLQGEENKEWEGRTSLQNSLRSLLKVPSLPCLIFVTKLQVSTDSRLYLGIDKRIRRLGKACHQNSQD